MSLRLPVLGFALMMLWRPQPASASATTAEVEQRRAEAFGTCLNDPSINTAPEPGSPSSFAGALQSRNYRGHSEYRTVSPGLYRYRGVQGRTAFCGIIFTGRPSAALIDAIGRLASAADMVPASLSYWSLGEPTEQKLRYWGHRLFQGGTGVLVDTHRLPNGTQITEIDYHEIAIP